MSIADKLLYLNETKTQLRQAINAVFGAGLTESDSFRSYADFLYDLWTPELLFQNGEQGAWYDPSDLSTLFQDAAGTTPVTADGDPVGLMLDLSGNGNHATRTSSAARPVYRTDGVLHWLDFDGVDDWLNLGGEAVSLFRNAEYGLLSAAHEASRISTQVLFSWSTDGGDGARIQLLGDNEVARFAGRRLDSDSYLAHQLSQVITGPRVQVSEVMWASGEYRITTNNLASQEGAFHTPGSTSDSDSFRATLGRQATSGSNTFDYQGKLFGAVAAREDRGAVEPLMRYLANLAGVTL